MSDEGHRLRKLFAASALAMVLALVACAGPEKPSVTAEQARIDFEMVLTLPKEPVDFDAQVKPVLDRRCVVCHGCYDTPCQLKLSSIEGIERGSNPQKVYDGARILATEPTRLFVDADTTEEWRAKGFHPVLSDTKTGTAEQNLLSSVLYRMLRLKERRPQARLGMLADDFTLELDRKQECPTIANFDEFAGRHPSWGMPYAMPNLAESEYRTLVQWVAQGSPASEPSEPSATALPEIRRWE